MIEAARFEPSGAAIGPPPGDRSGSTTDWYQPNGERCGDHDVAAYLAQINAMKRQFQRLAAGI
jgi:hypothetical protein